ncbi:N-acetyltransferase ESCO zinc-finger domain-containing protein [Plasmodiophora brassicae]
MSALDALMRRGRGGTGRRPTKKAKTGGGDGGGKRLVQMRLDVGQASIGSTRCPDCDMMYMKGEPQDDKQHAVYHASIVEGVAFTQQKSQIVDLLDGPRDSFALYRVHVGLQQQRPRGSIEQIIRRAQRDLGMDCEAPLQFAPGHQLFFVVATKSNRVAACAVCRPLTKAYVPDEANIRAAPSERNAVPARLGVDVIWVHGRQRRKKLASWLLDTARQHLTFGLPVPVAQVAFSQPTEAGAAFARSYTSARLLVYGPESDADNGT